MSVVKRAILAVLFVTAAGAQSPEPPLSETRLSIHTLVREDIFAGFLNDDQVRLARGEKSVQTLLEKRPAARAELTAWQGGVALYRAVQAYEGERKDEFRQAYTRAMELFAQARELGPTNGGVSAVTGGSFVVFADRLPKQERAAAWQTAYDAFQLLWKQQAPAVEKLPVHIRGELLGGLAQSAQRTGRAQEADQFLDRMLQVMHDTPYEAAARRWKEKPQTVANSGVTCLTCHDAGRLTAQMAAINGK